ncbi:molybdate ABC transporter permease subunit [Flavobacterium rhizosphaerae]|uniref:Molybdenum transport system permease n=1 Tax=Flavobacterium rhizosphaerae TaxID=3163298 RepID=A0ABW8YVH5_9FLAO
MMWEALQITFTLALITTFILLLVGVPLAYALAQSKSKLKPFIETIVTLPLVLPPTVLGFYMLLAFGKSGWMGKWLYDAFNIQLVFSFSGLIVASVIYSLPFMVQPLQSGFEQLPKKYREASLCLGKSGWETFFKVELPNIKPALLTAVILSFAHTIGEFGVVLMIGGNLPGKTKVASIAVYEAVEKMEYTDAHFLSLLLLLFSFSILFIVYRFNRNGFKILNR